MEEEEDEMLWYSSDSDDDDFEQRKSQNVDVVVRKTRLLAHLRQRTNDRIVLFSNYTQGNFLSTEDLRDLITFHENIKSVWQFWLCYIYKNPGFVVAPMAKFKLCGSGGGGLTENQTSKVITCSLPFGSDSSNFASSTP
ncbi:hypothetical protein VNO77_41808 [Canavalia gladiata]|uniref:Uncharacterized protein n=1 Tax=Canavalia gladiata TaxID=3824 RepID=A0AAN9PST7_CANGL